jgi:arginase
MLTNELSVIGYASGIAANNPDCSFGPLKLKESSFLQNLNLPLKWQDILYARSKTHGSEALPEVATLCQKLAKSTYQFTQNKQNPFLIIGGDHTSAIGTWSGVATSLEKKGPLGLIWIDAHMDSHTPETTHTNNIHGMPLAVLLGYGNSELTQIMSAKPKILPQHVVLIGVRSFESEEAELLKRLNVRIFYMEEIKKLGISAVFKEALKLVKNKTAGYGISLDVDAVDPKDAPGVGTPAPHGIHGQEFCTALTLCKNDAKLLGVEIDEFNPKLDQQEKTEKLIVEVINSIFKIQSRVD